MKNKALLSIIILLILILVYTFAYFLIIANKDINQKELTISNNITCYNTEIKVLYNGTVINGNSWVAEDSNQVTNKNLNLTKDGSNYIYWLENENYYIEPIQFVSHCNKDLGLLHLRPNVFKPGNVKVNITDYITNNTKLSISCKDLNSNNNFCGGVLKIEYYGNNKTSFMPFGGIIFLEHNIYFNSVSCQEWEDNSLIAIGYNSAPYISHRTDNTYKTFEVDKDFDKAEGGKRNIYCYLQISPKFLDKIKESPIYINIIPKNFWVSQDHSLNLGIDKWKDNDATLVGKGIIKKEIWIQ